MCESSMNYKTPQWEIRENQLNGEIHHVYRSEGRVIKMPILPKVIYNFNPIPKISHRALFFFNGNCQSDFKTIWKCKGPRKAKLILRKNKVQRFILPALKSYYKATVINIECYWWIKINETELEVQKWTNTHKTNWFLTTVLRQFNDEKITFLTNGTKKWTSTCTSHYLRKLTQNVS